MLEEGEREKRERGRVEKRERGGEKERRKETVPHTVQKER